MNQVKREFSCAVNGDTAVLTCYDVIGKMWGDPKEITAGNVKKVLDATGKFANIAIRINSPGGNAFEGIAIYNLVKSYNKPVAVFVDGLAASAASVIAMAGDTITMGTGSRIMIHNASTIEYGTASDMRKTADVLDGLSASIADIYVARTGADKSAIQKLMDNETYMSADEAVTNGFATDAVTGDEPDDLAATARSIIHAHAEQDGNLDFYKRQYALAVSRKR